MGRGGVRTNRCYIARHFLARGLRRVRFSGLAEIVGAKEDRHQLRDGIRSDFWMFMGLKSVRWEGRDVCPSKVVCVGRNYAEHIAELKNEVPESMVVFFKPNSAISDTLASGCSEERHYEAEICLLVNDGRFAAVGVGIDLTKRGLQSRLKEKGLPWERSKAFDGAAVFGDFVSLPQPIPELTVELRLNGSVVQRGSTGQMIYPPATIMEELKTFTTLQDGEIVMTGTPKGVGKIESGVVFSGRILDGERELVAKTWTAD